MSPSSRFRFGENWRSFLATVTEESVLEAERGLVRLLPESAIRGKTFLDIGCGSGLSMLAALRLGAAWVRGVDYDADSVEAARTLLTAHAPDGAWTAERKSVFDLTPDEDRAYDTVYSWGVLHHTGAVWRAMECASRMVVPGGYFAIALYRKTPLCALWTREKRLYADASAPVQSLIRELYIAAYRAALLAQFRNPSAYEKNYRLMRGMDWKHDVHDWLGGYPYESVDSVAVKADLKRLGFDIERVFEHPAAAVGVFGTHCDEFVAVRRGGGSA
jgi:2-polyprenyl-6-hydroxyphenyl methylase/3-demethylubiquinone-9 3-methyltransferase